MTYAQLLLTRLRAALDGASDYRIAKTLEITHQAVGRVKSGNNGLSDVTINKIAQVMDVNPMGLIAEYHLETQDFPSMNNVWEEMKRLSELENNKHFQPLTDDPLGNIPTL